jgi:hypothetical protein
MESLDELVLRKRRHKLNNPTTAPESFLQAVLFNYIPAAPLAHVQQAVHAASPLPASPSTPTSHSSAITQHTPSFQHTPSMPHNNHISPMASMGNVSSQSTPVASDSRTPPSTSRASSIMDMLASPFKRKPASNAYENLEVAPDVATDEDKLRGQLQADQRSARLDARSKRGTSLM